MGPLVTCATARRKLWTAGGKSENMSPGPTNGYFALAQFGYASCRFRKTAEAAKPLSRTAGRAAVFTAEPQLQRLQVSRPVAGQWERWVKPSVMAACLALVVAAPGACSRTVNCSGGDYGGGCIAGMAGPAGASPAAVSPDAGHAGAGPAGVGRGDPADFADVDDKHCRSYGLIFGSHDYADCRIRLSAQHRGLDPNIGTTMPGQGSR